IVRGCGGARYKPSVSSVKQARILLVGPVGAGKSSFFNSINSVFHGHITSQAVTGTTLESSVILKVQGFCEKSKNDCKLFPE
uniref:G domain-containing protein n=1 Tax=Scleropages formosus TaxID=113540 RepID=A0A8C9WNA6_SCLFO